MKTINDYERITATVYRPADGSDCTLGGVSSQINTVIIFGPGCGDDELREAIQNTPHIDPNACLKLEQRSEYYYSAYPLFINAKSSEGGWMMFGGNLAIVTNGIYFKTAQKWFNGNEDTVIHIHDRVENF